MSRLQIKCHPIQTNHSILPFLSSYCVSLLNFPTSNHQKPSLLCSVCYTFIVKHFAIVDLSLSLLLHLKSIYFWNGKWMGPSTRYQVQTEYPVVWILFFLICMLQFHFKSGIKPEFQHDFLLFYCSLNDK